jgi:hypothetical protein
MRDGQLENIAEDTTTDVVASSEFVSAKMSSGPARIRRGIEMP